MKNFEHFRAASFEEASEFLRQESNAKALAGGTDLLSVVKDEILSTTPSAVVDIKSIKGADEIKVSGNTIKIGALAKLSKIAEDEGVLKKATALAEAARSVATPLVRNLGTIGGNICQDVRCWYYRYPHEAGDRLECRRKGGELCYAIQGRNRYHSIYGGMKCDSSACTQGCPAATDIPGYMEQLRAGNIEGAAQILMQVNPIPAITGRVCAHFCQDECNQNQYGDSVAIRNVERFIGDYILKNKEKFYAAPKKSTGKKVAVVGSGPAGLSAAFYLRKAGNDVTVYDSKEEPGGMLMYAIPAYRLPKDIVREVIAAYKGMGIKFVTNTKIGDQIKPAQLEKDYDSVCYATGAWKRPVLGLAGEELTVFGLDFLVQVHDWMQGKIGKEVLVTGGGNVAMDVAITAKRLGAKKVILACLESEAEMPAGKSEIARAREEGIEILPSWGLSKVLSQNGKVTGMELMRCTSVRDADGRFNPQYDVCELKVVEAENILMCIGQQVDLSFLDDKYQLQLNRGLIDVAEDTQMTSRPGIFASGDATTGPKTVIQGIANGHTAARGMNAYLGVKAEEESVAIKKLMPFLTYDKEGIKEKKGLKLEEVPLEKRNIDIEDEIGAPEEAVLAEATRCMNCGCYSVAPSDITPALIALGATINTTKKSYTAEEFAAEMKVEDVLEPGELVTSIDVPVLEGAITHYDKFRLRESIDWAIVALASAFVVKGGKISTARLVLGGVAPIPVRLTAVEDYLTGKAVDDNTISKAAEMAVEQCTPMLENQYKVHEAKAMLKQALQRVK